MDGLLYPHLATLDPLLLNHKYMVQHVLCASETVLLLLWLLLLLMLLFLPLLLLLLLLFLLPAFWLDEEVDIPLHKSHNGGISWPATLSIGSGHTCTFPLPKGT